MKEKYFVDLFAGCGGLSLGLENAGFSPAMVNEISPEALETYLVNRDPQFPLLRPKYSVTDIHELVANDYGRLKWFVQQARNDYGFDANAGELDLVVGGPPCQGFSRIGHRRTHYTDRQQIASNHLYKVMAQVIGFLNPRLFLFENVVGLQTARWTANGKKGEIWEDVMRTFSSLSGYRVHSHVIRASYYGVPQNRPRVLVVGIRTDIQFTASTDRFANGYLPRPLDKPPTVADLLLDLVDPDFVNGGETLYYPSPPISPIQERMRFDPRRGQLSQRGDPLAEHKYSRHSDIVATRFKSMIDQGGILAPTHQTKKFSQRVLPLVWGDHGPNITITSLPDDYVHFAQPRTPTVREWARMQTFPDWYVFTGPRTTGSEKRAGHPTNGLLKREVPKYTQIGNAVPVAMAEAIGNHFISILSEEILPENVPAASMHGVAYDSAEW